MGRAGKASLVSTVSERADLPRATVNRVVTLLFEAITNQLARGDSVTMTGFGTWRARVCKPRVGRNPQNGAPIEIPARTKVSFKAGSKLRAGVEHAIDSEIFFGEGVGARTEIEGVLSHLFGADATSFHLKGAAGRFRAVLDECSEGQVEEFFEALQERVTGLEELVDPDR